MSYRDTTIPRFVINITHVYEILKKVDRNVVINILICILGIVLSLFIIGFVFHISKDVHQIKQKSCSDTESSLCYRGNPCELALITYIGCDDCLTCRAPGSTCDKFKCEYYPLANGSCCNKNDYCYTDDPNKACVFGDCKSTDITKCKGYCNSTDYDENYPCPQIPLVLSGGEEVVSFCLYNSCVTQVVLEAVYLDNPFDLIDTTNTSNLTGSNMKNCLLGSCEFTEFGSVCVFTWKCAPYNTPSIDSNKKRSMEIHSNTIDIEGWVDIKFPNNGLFGQRYVEYNRIMNEQAKLRYLRVFNLTLAPTQAPTSTRKRRV